MAITIGEWDRFYYNNIYAINKYLFEYGHANGAFSTQYQNDANISCI